MPRLQRNLAQCFGFAVLSAALALPGIVLSRPSQPRPTVHVLDDTAPTSSAVMPARPDAQALAHAREQAHSHALAQVRLARAQVVWLQTIAWNDAVAAAKRKLAAGAHVHPPSVAPAPVVGFVASGGSLDGVVACIYAHESGNYTEHSHPSDGSGAGQFIPSTWRTWSIRAGYVLRDATGAPVLDGNGHEQAEYAYAYLAPPATQDDVLRFALTNGGAGNWSPRYGNDPCTVGMGG